VILPDVNVLVYAARDDAPECARYRAWLEAVLASPACVAPALSQRLAGVLAEVCRRAGATADRVPDAYLAAMALDLDAELVTADRGFACYEGLRWRHPLDAAAGA